MVVAMSVKVCLVSPGHLAGNPRLVKEADALEQAGYQVRIVASRFIPWADAADTEFATRPWKLRRIAFGTLAHPLPRAYRSLRRRLARRLVALFGFRSPWVELAFHWITPELTRAACSEPAELYIAHNLAALPAVVKAARRFGARAIFDAEDFHSGELPSDASGDFDRKLVTALESKYLPQCDAITAASPGIARAYAQRYRIPQPDVVLNVFPREQAPPGADRKGNIPPGPSLYWFSQTTGANRGLESAVRALGLAKCRPHLYLRGAVSDSYRGQLEELARASGVAGHLHFLEPGAPADMARLAAQYDVGLAAEPGHSQNNLLACSNKIFTYLLAGLPTLASATPAQAEFAEQAQGAVFLYPPDDSQALAAALDVLLEDPATLASARLRAWSLGQQQFNWDIESQAWLSRVGAVINPDASRNAEPNSSPTMESVKS